MKNITQQYQHGYSQQSVYNKHINLNPKSSRHKTLHHKSLSYQSFRQAKERITFTADSRLFGNICIGISLICIFAVLGAMALSYTDLSAPAYISFKEKIWAPNTEFFILAGGITYLLMSITFGMLIHIDDFSFLRRDSDFMKERNAAISYLLTQLFLSVAWSWIFFTWQKTTLAFIVMLSLQFFLVLRSRYLKLMQTLF